MIKLFRSSAEKSRREYFNAITDVKSSQKIEIKNANGEKQTKLLKVFFVDFSKLDIEDNGNLEVFNISNSGDLMDTPTLRALKQFWEDYIRNIYQVFTDQSIKISAHLLIYPYSLSKKRLVIVFTILIDEYDTALIDLVHEFRSCCTYYLTRRGIKNCIMMVDHSKYTNFRETKYNFDLRFTIDHERIKRHIYENSLLEISPLELQKFADIIESSMPAFKSCVDTPLLNESVMSSMVINSTNFTNITNTANLPNSIHHIGFDIYGKEIYIPKPNSLALIGDYNELLAHLLQTDALASDLIILSTSVEDLTSQLRVVESVSQSIIEKQNLRIYDIEQLGLNFIEFVKFDSDFAKIIFLIWQTISNKSVDRDSINSIIEEILAMEDDEYIQIENKTFNDIFSDESNLDSFINNELRLQQFIATFKSILTMDFFNRNIDQISPLNEGGISIIDISKIDQYQQLAISLFFQLLKERGYISHTVAISGWEYFSRKQSIERLNHLLDFESIYYLLSNPKHIDWLQYTDIKFINKISPWNDYYNYVKHNKLEELVQNGYVMLSRFSNPTVISRKINVELIKSPDQNQDTKPSNSRSTFKKPFMQFLEKVKIGDTIDDTNESIEETSQLANQSSITETKTTGKSVMNKSFKKLTDEIDENLILASINPGEVVKLEDLIDRLLGFIGSERLKLLLDELTDRRVVIKNNRGEYSIDRSTIHDFKELNKEFNGTLSQILQRFIKNKSSIKTPDLINHIENRIHLILSFDDIIEWLVDLHFIIDKSINDETHLFHLKAIAMMVRKNEQIIGEKEVYLTWLKSFLSETISELISKINDRNPSIHSTSEPLDLTPNIVLIEDEDDQKEESIVEIENNERNEVEQNEDSIGEIEIGDDEPLDLDTNIELIEAEGDQSVDSTVGVDKLINENDDEVDLETLDHEIEKQLASFPEYQYIQSDNELPGSPTLNEENEVNYTNNESPDSNEIPDSSESNEGIEAKSDDDDVFDIDLDIDEVENAKIEIVDTQVSNQNNNRKSINQLINQSYNSSNNNHNNNNNNSFSVESIDLESIHWKKSFEHEDNKKFSLNLSNDLTMLPPADEIILDESFTIDESMINKPIDEIINNSKYLSGRGLSDQLKDYIANFQGSDNHVVNLVNEPDLSDNQTFDINHPLEYFDQLTDIQRIILFISHTNKSKILDLDEIHQSTKYLKIDHTIQQEFNLLSNKFDEFEKLDHQLVDQYYNVELISELLNDDIIDQSLQRAIDTWGSLDLRTRRSIRKSVFEKFKLINELDNENKIIMLYNIYKYLEIDKNINSLQGYIIHTMHKLTNQSKRAFDKISFSDEINSILNYLVSGKSVTTNKNNIPTPKIPSEVMIKHDKLQISLKETHKDKSAISTNEEKSSSLIKDKSADSKNVNKSSLSSSDIDLTWLIGINSNILSKLQKHNIQTLKDLSDCIDNNSLQNIKGIGKQWTNKLTMIYENARSIDYNSVDQVLNEIGRVKWNNFHNLDNNKSQKFNDKSVDITEFWKLEPKSIEIAKQICNQLINNDPRELLKQIFVHVLFESVINKPIDDSIYDSIGIKDIIQILTDVSEKAEINYQALTNDILPIIDRWDLSDENDKRTIMRALKIRLLNSLSDFVYNDTFKHLLHVRLSRQSK
jgi:hypothetical protein